MLTALLMLMPTEMYLCSNLFVSLIKRMTNHSYKGLTQPLQTGMAKPHPAKRRMLVS